jgi:glutamate-ammonia-ligase adenylyltransferase
MHRFVEYHKTEAELWERQAHVRARVVYGSEKLRAEIEEATEAFVYGKSLDSSGVAEIDSLENELADENSKRRNIKTGRGGIVDIEFVVQMLLLRYGVDYPQVRKQGTAEAIEALAAAELIPKADAQILSGHYLFLRRLEARLRLERDRPVEAIGTDARVIAPLAKRLGFGGEDPGAELLARYAVVREEVRGLYERYFRSDTH